MKVKWIGKTSFLMLTHGKIYDVLSVEKGWYRVVDDSGEDYLYPPEYFEIESDEGEIDLRSKDVNRNRKIRKES